MPINNIVDLRDFIADQLQELCKGNMKPEQANACAMLSANMLLSIKLEMDYSKLIQEKPAIDFMGSPKKTLLIEHKKRKSIR